MMKPLFRCISIIIFISLQNQAFSDSLDVIEFPKNISYQVQAKSIKPWSNFQYRLFEKLLLNNQIELFVDSKKSLKAFDVDLLYSDLEFNKTIMVKFDLLPSDEQILNKLITVDNGFLLHSKTDLGTPMAIYFLEFNQKEVQEFAQIFNLKISRIPTIEDGIIAKLGELLFLSNAYAQLDICFQEDQILNEINQSIIPIQQEMKKTVLNKIVKGVADCSIGLGLGIYDGTVGVAIKTYQSAKSLVKKTAFAIKHPKEAWQSVVHGFKTVIQTITHLNKVLKNISKQYKNSSPEDQVINICRAISRTTVILAEGLYLSGGWQKLLKQIFGIKLSINPVTSVPMQNLSGMIMNVEANIIQIDNVNQMVDELTKLIQEEAPEKIE